MFVTLGENGLILKTKTWVLSAFGSMGLSIANYAEAIAFHEAAWFKAVLAISGLILGVLAIYSMYLDVRIKKRNLGED